MDHETRRAAALETDPALAARIVRSIKQVESDYDLASGAFSERMMSEAAQAIEKAAPAPWQIIETDAGARMVCPEWKMTKGVGTGDAWLELAEIGADEERDYTWISAAVRTGPTRLGLELTFRRGLQDSAEIAIRNDKHVAALLKLGMVRDDTGPCLFISIDIAAEALAQGFEVNDLNKALAPVSKAVEKAIAAKPELDKLIEQVRSTKRG